MSPCSGSTRWTTSSASCPNPTYAELHRSGRAAVPGLANDGVPHHRGAHCRHRRPRSASESGPATDGDRSVTTYPGAGGVVVTGGASGIGDRHLSRARRGGTARVRGARPQRRGGGGRWRRRSTGSPSSANVADQRGDRRTRSRVVAEEIGGHPGPGEQRRGRKPQAVRVVHDREVDLIFGGQRVGTYNGIRSAAPCCGTSGGAAMVNLASVSGVRPTRGEAPYSAAKAATIALDPAAASGVGPRRAGQLRVAGVRADAAERDAGVEDSAREALEDRHPARAGGHGGGDGRADRVPAVGRSRRT